MKIRALCALVGDEDLGKNPYCIIACQARTGSILVELPSRYCKGKITIGTSLAEDGYTCAIYVVDHENSAENYMVGVQEGKDLLPGQFRTVFLEHGPYLCRYDPADEVEAYITLNEQHNRKEIEMSKLQAGRELDALVAVKVMGWEKGAASLWKNPDGKLVPYDSTNDLHPLSCSFPFPRYSTDITAAWEVAEALNSEPFHLHVSIVAEGAPSPAGRWEVTIIGKKMYRVHDDSAPLAICRAALKAVENAHEP